MIFVDTNILIDIANTDPVWADWSRQRLVDAASLDETWALEDRVLSRVPYPRAEAVELALEEASAEHPEARSRRPGDFFDDRYLRELDASGFIAGLYR